VPSGGTRKREKKVFRKDSGSDTHTTSTVDEIVQVCRTKEPATGDRLKLEKKGGRGKGPDERRNQSAKKIPIPQGLWGGRSRRQSQTHYSTLGEKKNIFKAIEGGGPETDSTFLKEFRKGIL